MSSKSVKTEAKVEANAEAEAVTKVETINLEALNRIKNITTIFKQIADNEIERMTHAISNAITDREEFEKAKDEHNLNIQRTLKKVRSQLVNHTAAKVMLAANVDPSFINRTLHDGSRYNVYAIGKFGDLMRGIIDGNLSNAINNAVVRSIFAFHAASEEFTADTARAAASDKVRLENVKARKLLTSHTVSASTAPTQASSTMQALQTLGVVVTTGSVRKPTYHLTPNPVTKRLYEAIKSQEKLAEVETEAEGATA